jgi:hypothetical protein
MILLEDDVGDGSASFTELRERAVQKMVLEGMTLVI